MTVKKVFGVVDKGPRRFIVQNSGFAPNKATSEAA
jgi:hypothetical protein